MIHKFREVYVCDCGFRTKYLQVLEYHVSNPDTSIGRKKLMELTS
jgi:hypothetical protein